MITRLTWLAIGIVLGAAAMWLWTKRDLIAGVAKNRGNISGAGKILDGLSDLNVDSLKELFS